ncbi:MAG TPA: phosphoenolpyruvate synthase, partial [Devosia sp.]|nr:phosphoenolpyruvate synthase [Devosia sp.]
KPVGLALVREWLRVGMVGARLLFEALRLKGTMRGFYRRLNAALEKPASTLEEMSLSELAAEYRRIEASLLDRWDAPLVNDFLCMMAFGASRKLLEKWAGPAGLATHNDIMIGQGDIISAEPARRIATMAETLSGHEELRAELARGDGRNLGQLPVLEMAVANYLEKFSDRCAEELKLESVPLNRDPSPLYMAIAAAALAPSGKAHPAQNKQTASTLESGLDELFAGRPLRRFVSGLIVGWAKTLVKNRENLRFERTRIFGRARHLFRAVGSQFFAHGLLEDADEIYYLSVSEVLGTIEGFAISAEIGALAGLRRAEMQAAGKRPDPAERIVVRGAAFARSGPVAGAKPATPGDATSQTGTGCSAGKVTAVARIVRDPRKQSINRGEILVARHTDPGWIALFCNASAIVVERGSLLSHSAIVARELGIPCVVGLKGAMDWIVDGETIEVDGATGVVRRLK